MLIKLHKKATTTVGVWDYIRTCGKGIKTLAKELNLNRATARKWRGREDAQDASHRPHRMRRPSARRRRCWWRAAPLPSLLVAGRPAAATRAHIHPQASRAAIGRLPSGRACRGWPA